MISSPFMISAVSTNVNASAASAGAQVAQDYGNLMQYEWPNQYHDSFRNRRSDGPAPASPDILWKKYIPNLSSVLQETPCAFNGKVFVQNATHTFALDPFTGNTIYTTPYVGVIQKIDATRMTIGNRYCLLTETGSRLWTFTDAVAANNFGNYIPEEKMSYSLGLNPTYPTLIQAWDWSNLAAPPVRSWTTVPLDSVRVPEYGQTLDGQGILVLSVDYGTVTGLSAKNGTVLWETLVW